MPIRKFTIEPAFTNVAGDKYFTHGHVLEQERGGVVIDTRTYVMHLSAARAEAEVVGGPSITRFYMEYHMPGVSATLTKVLTPSGTGGVHRYRFGDGEEREYANRATAIAAVEYLDTDTATAKDVLILASLRKDEEGANAGVMEGRCCTVDCNAQLPLSLSLGIEVS